MKKTQKITFTAILTAIAAVLMFFEFPLPFMPPFLKIDLSGAVVLMGVFLLGPMSGIAIAFLKDLIHLTISTTGGSGELADFLILTTLVLGVAAAEKVWTGSRGKGGVACIVGTAAMAIMGVLTNQFLIIPFYAQIMPIDAIISACHAVNPAINGLQGYLLFGVLPFNLIKGAILSTLALMIAQRLSHVLTRFSSRHLNP